ncbi:MAG: shikimate dehydrogenase [Gammaproteobacteria bacterium]|nr:shikimate dehydrogenase [Gammaproteobacteria bacterium]
MSDPFDFRARPHRFAVMGNPVAHSRSPCIHRRFARQFDLDIDYRRIQVERGGFAQAVSHFAARDGAGLNITLPFKVEAWRLCGAPGNTLTARAAQAQAVNTVSFERGAMRGDNTDGVGMIRDLEDNRGWEIAGRRALLLGAGGAARGVAWALLERRPALLAIANRSANKARELAASLRGGDGGHGDGGGDGGDGGDGGGGIPITACGLADLDGDFDLLINATSAGIDDTVPAIDAACIGPGCVAYDLMYADAPTAFMNWARAHGAVDAGDGLGMLVEQAAESFHLWHRRRPDTAPVLRALRAGQT